MSENSSIELIEFQRYIDLFHPLIVVVGKYQLHCNKVVDYKINQPLWSWFFFSTKQIKVNVFFLRLFSPLVKLDA